MEITIKIPAIDNLADAIRTLAKEQAVNKGSSNDGPVAHLAPSTPVTYDETVYNPPAAPVAPTAPPAAPVAPPAAYMAPTAAPEAPTAPPAPPVAPPAAPTAPATYTRQQLAIAATGLVDAGRKNDLVALLSQFGIKSLTELQEQNFGVFATALRQLGAAI